MNNEVLFCEGCEDFFETIGEDMAATIRQMRADWDTAHKSILCDDCTLKVMVAEEEDDEIIDDVCYRCGDALSNMESDICYTCTCAELDEEQTFHDEDGNLIEAE